MTRKFPSRRTNRRQDEPDVVLDASLPQFLSLLTFLPLHPEAGDGPLLLEKPHSPEGQNTEN